MLLQTLRDLFFIFSVPRLNPSQDSGPALDLDGAESRSASAWPGSTSNWSATLHTVVYVNLQGFCCLRIAGLVYFVLKKEHSTWHSKFLGFQKGDGMFVPYLNISIPNLDFPYKIPDPDRQQWKFYEELKYLWTKNMEIWTEMFIPDPRSRIPPDFFSILDPSTGSQIRIRKTAKKPRNGTLGNSNQRILISSNQVQMPFLLRQTQIHKNFIRDLPIFPSIETMKGLFSVALIFLHRKLHCYI